MYKKKTGRSPLHIKGCDLFIAFFCLVTDQMNGRVSDCRNFNGIVPLFLGDFPPYPGEFICQSNLKPVYPTFLQGQVYKTILIELVGNSKVFLRSI